jgi:RNA polymerase sigma-70 factor (ECF subfamily)
MGRNVKDIAGRLWEQALVVRSQAGDEKAFEELVRVFHKRISYYVERLVGDPHDAGDVLQDVWVDVYRQLPRLRSVKAFRAWLYRIARDKVYQMFRKRSRWMTEPVDMATVEDPSEEPAFSDEDAGRIHECLDRLSPEHREVLVLRFVEDMSYEEIAAAIRCPLGTVQSRIHYAKSSLRTEMGEVDHDG